MSSEEIAIKEIGDQLIIVSAGNHNCYLSKEQADKLYNLLSARKANEEQVKPKL